MISLEGETSWASKVVPVRVSLSEELSRCYSLVLDFFASGANLDATEALNRKATVTLDVPGAEAEQTRKITGVITEMSLSGILPDGKAWYRMTLVPRVALLDLTRRSRVFCTEKPGYVRDVLAQVLKEADGVRLSAADYALRLESQAYPLRDMVVQYQESDLAFLSRLAEDAGIFFFFQAGEEDEQIVFADENLAFPWLGGDAERSILRYEPSVGVAQRGPSVLSAKLEARLVPAKVRLQERNYIMPKMDLLVEAVAGANGVGLISSDEREGYREAGWGRVLAHIRAEEAAANRCVLTGQSDCVALAAGIAFTLEKHPSAAANDRYVTVSVSHSVWESAEGIEYLPGPGPQGSGYQNHFTAIPLATRFRPARRTPRPRVAGLMRATIDGVDDVRSNIDGLGRYRIKFPFDRVSRAPGRSSSAVRLVTPYGGPTEGFHFPLRAKTQVMIAFHNGDPDRPVIVGPLYDASQKSVVTTKNRTANVISTVTGITVTMNDGTAKGNR